MKLAIIGNGVAGVTTARYVAERDPSFEITIYSREPYAYYPRPRLVDLIAGETTLEGLFQYGPDWYAERHIATRLSSDVVAIEPGRQSLVLRGGDQAPYDVLVLATGASSFVPPIAGATKQGVQTLRTLEDALRLCEGARSCGQIVIVGGGLLGLDVAVSLRHWGCQITVLEALPRLLPRQLDPEGAAMLQHLIEERGIQVIVGDLCDEVLGEGSVTGVRLRSGRELAACLLLILAGVRPNTALASEAGLPCQRGILVNERMQTSLPDIYAVGDCAEFGGHVWGIIPAALAQARVAGSQIAGAKDVVYEDIVPSTTLKVSGIDLTSLGEVNPEADGAQEYRYVDQERGIYKKLVVRDGRVVGAILLGDRADLQAVSPLVTDRMDVSDVAERLLDPAFDLRSWVRARH